MFANARGVGVLELPTSEIFEIINLHYRLLHMYVINQVYYYNKQWLSYDYTLPHQEKLFFYLSRVKSF